MRCRARTSWSPTTTPCSARDECQSLFNLGHLSLENRGLAEDLFWAICQKILRITRTLQQIPEELEGLERQLADTYFCNFSVFQSLPDSWAIDQLFPVVPIHRLSEEPANRAVLADITCDSDGKIDHFIDRRDVKDVLELHEYHHGEPYYLGVFLVGAYQEILGDLHNLFGDTNTVHVALDPDDDYKIEGVINGDTVDRRAALRALQPGGSGGPGAAGHGAGPARQADDVRGVAAPPAALRGRAVGIHLPGAGLNLQEGFAMKTLAPVVDSLIDQLRDAVRLRDVAAITSRIKEDLESFIPAEGLMLPERFRQPKPNSYARRLLYKDEDLGFTALIMTWGPGQKTALHDHAGIWCVEGVVEGKMEVTRYELMEELADGRCRFEQRGAPVPAMAGSAGALIPPFEHHVLANAADRPSLTLHVYGGEMTHCNIFEPLGDGLYKPSERALSYDD